MRNLHFCFYIFLLAGFIGCNTQPPRPVSDHFDGSRFFNPTHPEDQSNGDILKYFLSDEDRKPWPEHVDNQPKLNLQAALKDNQVAVTFVNHATVLMQIPGLNILTDPIWSVRASPSDFAGPTRVRDPGIAFDELPKIDVVLISHNHYDHLDLPTLQRLEDKFHPLFLVPLGDGPLLHEKGMKNVVEMDWWEHHALTNTAAEVVMMPTQHFSGRAPWDRNQTLWGGYLLRYHGEQIYFGGDTAYSTHFKDSFQKFGPMNLSFLPIGAYEPRWFMSVLHMNPEEAAQAHLDLHSQQSIGIHFGTFHMSNEEINAPVEDLKKALSSHQIPPSTFRTLGEGQTEIFTLHATGPVSQ